MSSQPSAVSDQPETEHTPEPWRIFGHDLSLVLDGKPFRVDSNLVTGIIGPGKQTSAIGVIFGPAARRKANVRRIVACVNACEGIDTKMLETGISIRGLLVLAQEIQIEANNEAVNGFLKHN